MTRAFCKILTKKSRDAGSKFVTRPNSPILTAE
jgi:hypothetical protein